MIYFFGIFFILYGLFAMLMPRTAAKFRYFFVVKNGEVSDFAIIKEIFIGIMIFLGGIILLFI